MIKNIIFDLGGVILTEDDNWVNTNETRELLNTTDEQLNKGWSSAWSEGRDGKSNEIDFFRSFLKNSVGQFDDQRITKLKELYRNMANTFGAYSYLSKLVNNFKLFSLTNITKDWLEYKKTRFKLDDYFDLIIASCNEGIAKPNREIFEALINKGRIVPSESLFIDNMEKNIKPAKELSFNTILYNNNDHLTDELIKLNIVV